MAEIGPLTATYSPAIEAACCPPWSAPTCVCCPQLPLPFKASRQRQVAGSKPQQTGILAGFRPRIALYNDPVLCAGLSGSLLERPLPLEQNRRTAGLAPLAGADATLANGCRCPGPARVSPPASWAASPTIQTDRPARSSRAARQPSRPGLSLPAAPGARPSPVPFASSRHSPAAPVKACKAACLKNNAGAGSHLMSGLPAPKRPAVDSAQPAAECPWSRQWRNNGK